MKAFVYAIDSSGQRYAHFEIEVPGTTPIIGDLRMEGSETLAETFHRHAIEERTKSMHAKQRADRYFDLCDIARRAIP